MTQRRASRLVDIAEAVPHVYVNRRGPDHGNDVVMDEPGAVRMFLDHVTRLGHRSVAPSTGRPRWTPFTGGWARHGGSAQRGGSS
jgi:DNA-binding LacI/PurR family transcriptional regulator